MYDRFSHEQQSAPRDVILFKYDGRCWWCGNTADTGEHKYKRSDLVREFGNGPWKNSGGVVRIESGSTWQQQIQSPRADVLKFARSLCEQCNSSRSQKFDLAYSQFSSYVFANERDILHLGKFRFSEIYGRYWKPQRRNLLRYFLKHIGCRLAESGIEVPPEAIHYLNGTGKNIPTLAMQLEIREDIAQTMNLLAERGADNGCFWIGEMTREYSIESARIHRAHSSWGYRWLRLDYIFDESMTGDVQTSRPTRLGCLVAGISNQRKLR